jgi:predicted metal-dependent HD superfamily phosphohydrolase
MPSDMTTLARWRGLMKALQLDSNEAAGEALLAAYGEAHRHYHSLRHLEDCLAKLDVAAELAEEPAEVEIALWFHDAIYNPMKGGNELASAEWAKRFLTEAGAKPGSAESVYALVMATQHAVPATTRDAKLLVDIDLSILGANDDDYDAFEKNVRKEYRWVPYFLYRKKRREVLQSFLDRPAIYENALFRDQYELKARENLRRAIAAL